jgi:hypothetical protein
VATVVSGHCMGVNPSPLLVLLALLVVFAAVLVIEPLV